MKYSSYAMSAILLCSHLAMKEGNNIKPFTLGEWYRFLKQLNDSKRDINIILNTNREKLLKNIGLDSNTIHRICLLLERGKALALELDDLSRKGIEVVTIFDKEYPILIKKRLKKKSPPLFYYAGDIRLCNKIGVAVVGARNIDEAGIEFTKKLVEKASKEHLLIYSGGAKGVDSISEKTAVKNGSAVVSFIAESLVAKIKKKEIIEAIQQQKLLLLSDVNPDAGFSSARAMSRNRYIYAASYGAFAVSAQYNKGGTWSGALENIKNNWVKTFVWNHKTYIGNIKLIEKGGIAYELSDRKIYDLITEKETYTQMNLFH